MDSFGNMDFSGDMAYMPGNEANTGNYTDLVLPNDYFDFNPLPQAHSSLGLEGDLAFWLPGQQSDMVYPDVSSQTFDAGCQQPQLDVSVVLAPQMPQFSRVEQVQQQQFSGFQQQQLPVHQWQPQSYEPLQQFKPLPPLQPQFPQWQPQSLGNQQMQQQIHPLPQQIPDWQAPLPQIPISHQPPPPPILPPPGLNSEATPAPRAAPTSPRTLPAIARAELRRDRPSLGPRQAETTLIPRPRVARKRKTTPDEGKNKVTKQRKAAGQRKEKKGAEKPQTQSRENGPPESLEPAPQARIDTPMDPQLGSMTVPQIRPRRVVLIGL
jgi:hypothetical protein